MSTDPSSSDEAAEQMERVPMTIEEPRLVDLTATIVSAYVANNPIRFEDLPTLIATVHKSLSTLGQPPSASAVTDPLSPAVSIKASVKPDYLVCLEDGRKFKSLRRHLGSLGMTPDRYRVKWGLPPDYPMVAPNYSAVRASIAKASGLGVVGEKPRLTAVA